MCVVCNKYVCMLELLTKRTRYDVKMCRVHKTKKKNGRIQSLFYSLVKPDVFIVYLLACNTDRSIEEDCIFALTDCKSVQVLWNLSVFITHLMRKCIYRLQRNGIYGNRTRGKYICYYCIETVMMHTCAVATSWRNRHSRFCIWKTVNSKTSL